MNKLGSFVFPALFLVSLALNFFLGFLFLRNKQKQLFEVSRVIDGDTFKTKDGKLIRILGIRAPEPGRCGAAEAKIELEKLVLDKQVSFSATTSDVFSRLVADVYDEREQSVNLAMIVSGWAVYNSSDSINKDKMREAGEAAREQKRGVFGEKCTQFTNPENPECTIKGNFNDSSGKKIYTFLGCSKYAETAVNLFSGDQWFCSETAAVAAGFTKSKNCFGKMYPR